MPTTAGGNNLLINPQMPIKVTVLRNSVVDLDLIFSKKQVVFVDFGNKHNDIKP
jgi:hypothetical protein